MMQSIYIMLGVMAFVLLLFTWWTPDDTAAIVTGLSSTITWGVWAFASFTVEVSTESSGIVTNEYPALAVLGAMFALSGLFVALTGPVALINPRAHDGSRPEAR